MVLAIRSGDEFMREIIKLTEADESIISGFETRDEVLQYIAGSIGTKRLMTLNLLEPEAAKGMVEYLDKKEDEFRKIADRLPKAIMPKPEFRVIELDILRGVPGHTSMIKITADTASESIKKFYELLPAAGDHILAVRENCITEHFRHIKPKIVR